jgi:hypothetical protein
MFSSSAARGVASRGPIAAASSSVSLFSASRSSWLVARMATGNATSAVTSTATTATAQVTRTARPLRVRNGLRIDRVADAAYGADHRRRLAELAP